MNTATDTATFDILGAPVPVLSFSPVMLPVPGRPVDMQVRVSAPATGTGLPVILLSHGRSTNRSCTTYGT